LTPDATGAPHEFGRSKQGTPELLVHLYLPELGRTYVSPMYFSPEAAPYSEERLRTLGCISIETLAGIDANEVEVDVKHEWYEGRWRLRVEVVAAGGVFHTSNPMQGGGKEFAATAATMLGRPINLGPAGTSAQANGAAPKPPF
jgi:hypothetical protein